MRADSLPLETGSRVVPLASSPKGRAEGGARDSGSLDLPAVVDITIMMEVMERMNTRWSRGVDEHGGVEKLLDECKNFATEILKIGLSWSKRCWRSRGEMRRSQNGDQRRGAQKKRELKIEACVGS